MQLADNYYQMGCWKEAERRYKLTQYMCPSRFLPLQGLLRNYIKSDNCILAERVALEIINKRIKIPSYTVSIIQEEARNYLRKKKQSIKRIINKNGLLKCIVRRATSR